MLAATLTLAAVGWLATVGWLLARAVGQFRAYEVIGPEQAPPAQFPPITVIVPARNEARSIGPCVASLQAQDYPPGQLEIIVVDDQSTDETAELVRRAAAADARVQLVSLRGLPAGWTGKPHACWEGAARARGEWLCFVDADTIAQPPLLRSAVAAAEQRQLDFLSLEPRQVLGSFWERLILPCGFVLAAFLLDLRRFNDPRRPEAAANGQFLLIRRASYLACDGHRGVRSAIAEDTALARRLKHGGCRVALLGAEALIETRMYRGLGELWPGLRKNLVVMTGGVGATCGAALAALLLAAAAVGVPLATLAWWRTAPSRLALAAVGASGAASLALLLTHVATSRRLRIPWWYGCTFPLGYALGALLAYDSVLRWHGGNVTWKGRSYAPLVEEAAAEKQPAP